MDVNANSAAMKAARAAIPADDASKMEVMMAAIKPGTGEVLGFGINKIYDTSPEANNDPARTAMNFAVDRIDGGGSGFPGRLHMEADQPGGLDAQGALDQRGAAGSGRREPIPSTSPASAASIPGT